MTQNSKGYSYAEEKPEKKKKNKLSTIIIIFAVLVILACVAYIGSMFFNEHSALVSYGQIAEIAVNSESGGSGKVSSPVNLESLHEINDEVYAWLRVPGTHVDYPVVQSTISDNYYLHRSIYKRYLFAGMIYTQSCNSLDFMDPVTVVYGHNMRSKTMFSTLHYFSDPSFFEKNDTFYIYTLDRILTYKIVSAYKYDSRHIMNSFNFSNPETLRSFQEHTLNPVTTVRNVRSDVTLDENSKLVILSTCMTNDKKSRFLVNGVLVSDVPIS